MLLKKIKVIVLGLLFICVHFVNGQSTKGKDFLNIKAPALNYPAPNPDDILFEEDGGFIKAVTDLGKTSKRPIIMTCTSSN